MALLDDLKSESERRMRAELEQQRNRTQTEEDEYQEREYRRRILPAMQRILTYLSQLADHLNYIKPHTRPCFTIPGYGDIDLEDQSGYRVSVHTRERPERITLTFQTTGSRPRSFKVTPLSVANDLDDLLVAYGLDFSITDYRDGYRHLVGRRFELRPKVPVTVQVEADPASSQICFAFTNFESPATSRTHYAPEQITDQFLDDLGNYILRKSDKLTQLDIPDEVRKKLRQRMEAEKREEQPRRGGLLSKIFRSTD
jgi:hypothetical protein